MKPTSITYTQSYRDGAFDRWHIQLEHAGEIEDHTGDDTESLAHTAKRLYQELNGDFVLWLDGLATYKGDREQFATLLVIKYKHQRAMLSGSLGDEIAA
jgi:hypothetical protein